MFLMLAALTSALYLTGALVKIVYGLSKISDLKKLHDVTRTKDTKNETISLAKGQVISLSKFWLWPLDVTTWIYAFRWARGLSEK